MSYIIGQRVLSHDGKRRGTIAADAADHASVRVLWDGEDAPRWELPECVMLQEQQPGPGLRDAWLRGDDRLQKASTK